MASLGLTAQDSFHFSCMHTSTGKKRQPKKLHPLATLRLTLHPYTLARKPLNPTLNPKPKNPTLNHAVLGNTMAGWKTLQNLVTTPKLLIRLTGHIFLGFRVHNTVTKILPWLADPL